MEEPPRIPSQGETGHEREPGTPQPRIYIASLSDYNNGDLVGEWVDAAQSDDELAEAAQAVLAQSNEPMAEEFAVFDYDGFGPLRLDEYESLTSVGRLARGIARHGIAFAHYAAAIQSTDSDQLRLFDAAYEGHYSDLKEYGEQILESVFAIDEALDESVPAFLVPYISVDAEGFVLDMAYNGMIATSEGDEGIYVFNLGVL